MIRQRNCGNVGGGVVVRGVGELMGDEWHGGKVVHSLPFYSTVLCTWGSLKREESIPLPISMDENKRSRVRGQLVLQYRKN